MAETPPLVVNVVPSAPTPSPISPKVIASTLATLAVSVVVAIITSLVNDPATLAHLLDAVPAWLRFVIVAALPTVATFLAGYAKRDTTRELGQVVTDRITSSPTETLTEHPAAHPEPEDQPEATAYEQPAPSDEYATPVAADEYDEKG